MSDIFDPIEEEINKLRLDDKFPEQVKQARSNLALLITSLENLRELKEQTLKDNIANLLTQYMLPKNAKLTFQSSGRMICPWSWNHMCKYYSDDLSRDDLDDKFPGHFEFTFVLKLDDKKAALKFEMTYETEFSSEKVYIDCDSSNIKLHFGNRTQVSDLIFLNIIKEIITKSDQYVDFGFKMSTNKRGYLISHLDKMLKKRSKK